MTTSINGLCALVALLGLLLSSPIPARGGVIVDPTNSFAVGIDTLGNLFDPGSQVGFLRIADGYDPILAAVSREAWGVSAGGASGEVDPQGLFGVVNIVANGPAIFGPHSALIGTALMTGAAPILRIEQSYGFAADNVLRIATTITNLGGTALPVLYSRQVGWNIVPGSLFNYTAVPPLSGRVVAATEAGSEDADPTVRFQNPATPGGRLNGPDNLGAGFQLDLGTIANGASTSFAIDHAISRIGQTRRGLLDELSGLGSTYTITATSVGGPIDNGTLSAALGFGPVATDATTASPEPATWISAWLGVAVFVCIAVVAGSRRRTPA